MPYPLFPLLICVALLASCDRKPTSVLEPDEPIRIPSDATFEVTSRDLPAMLAFARPLLAGGGGADLSRRLEGALGFSPTDASAWVERGVDPNKPVTAFCDPTACALRVQGRWTAPDATLEVVEDDPYRVLVWGVWEPDTLDRLLSRWRDPAKTHAPTLSTDVSGRVDLRAALQGWDLTRPRARALVRRATEQSTAIEFSATVGDGALEVTLDVQDDPGEPRFVDELGEPRADLPRVAGLVDAGVLAVVRLSADPNMLWALGRSLLSAEQRGELDALGDTLRAEASVDLQSAILDNVTGHVVVVSYGLDGEPPTGITDWVTLKATRDAVLVPIADPTPVRRLFDAWTQLSKGRLHVQEARGERLQWAWVEDGELRWSALVGRDYVLFVDSSVALRHASRWQNQPEPLSRSLRDRGVDTLLEARSRSGLYLDLAALRAVSEGGLASWFPTIDAVTLIEDRSGTRLRLSLSE